MRKLAILSDYTCFEGAVHEGGALLVDGERISGFDTKPTPEKYLTEGRTAIDRGHSVVIPGLINLHCHMPMVYYRGFADDLPLQQWLNDHILPTEALWLSPEFCRDATLLAACELALGGVTYVADMYYFCEQVAESLEKVGLRGLLGQTVFDFPCAGGKGVDDYLSQAEQMIDKYRGHPLIAGSIAPHAPYTTSPETLRRCRDLADRKSVLMQTHAAETVWEDGEIRGKHGCSPIELLAKSGFLGEDVLLAHCVHLSDNDIGILASAKAGVAHCPSSNLKLASGVCPVPRLITAGVRIGLGTDGAASGNTLDLLGEMSLAAKLHKVVAGDPAVLDATTVLHMATAGAALALGREDLGVLREGASADFTVVNLDSANTVPLYHPISHLTYAVKAADVSDVYVAGRPVVERRRITGVDLDEVKERARWWAKRIWQKRSNS